MNKQTDMLKASGGDQAAEFTDRLNRITQLTGFSDPVYAEACVTVHEYDVALDILCQVLLFCSSVYRIAAAAAALTVSL